MIRVSQGWAVKNDAGRLGEVLSPNKASGVLSSFLSELNNRFISGQCGVL